MSGHALFGSLLLGGCSDAVRWFTSAKAGKGAKGSEPHALMPRHHGQRFLTHSVRCRGVCCSSAGSGTNDRRRREGEVERDTSHQVGLALAAGRQSARGFDIWDSGPRG